MPIFRPLLALVVTLAVTASPLTAQPLPPRQPEVRQIVTFLFQPGRAADATAIYETQLKPLYTDLAPLRRFRAYREAESPEPLDLIVVSTYQGMAGMDAANAALRTPPTTGRSAFAIYGTLAAMSQSHHDQFVEMLPQIGPAPDDSAGIVVFEYLRVPAKDQPEFVVRTDVERRAELPAGLLRWSEFGRLLVSDGWDFLRIHHLRSLGDWQRYRALVRQRADANGAQFLVTARKTIIVKLEPRLSVR